MKMLTSHRYSVDNIYIAGPMSGYKNFNYDAFNRVALQIRGAGYKALNPAEFQDGCQEKTFHQYMRHDLQIILSNADALVTLPGWEQSPGACNEVTVAKAIGIPVWTCEELEIEVQLNEREAMFCTDHPGLNKAVEEIKPKAQSAYIGDDYRFDGVLGKWVKKDAESILEEAQRLVHGNRGEDYGHPLDDFSKTALIGTAVLAPKLKDGEALSAEDVALFMVGVKISRQVNRPKRDNLVDGAGYFETLSMVIEERQRRGNAQVAS